MGKVGRRKERGAATHTTRRSKNQSVVRAQSLASAQNAWLTRAQCSHLAPRRRHSAQLGATTVRKRTRALEPTIAPKDAVGRRSDGAHPQQLLPSCGRWLAEHELLRALWPLRD